MEAIVRFRASASAAKPESDCDGKLDESHQSLGWHSDENPFSADPVKKLGINEAWKDGLERGLKIRVYVCSLLLRDIKMLGTVLLVILILLLLGAIPAWPHSRNWGYAPSGGLGLIVLIIVILLLLGRI